MSVAVVLRRQTGVISRGQALAEGMSSSAIGRRVARGEWVRLYPRVYLAADHELTCAARVRAAVLWAGPSAVLSGVAAAWWHGLWEEPSIVEVTVGLRRQLVARPGVRVRRRVILPEDVVDVGGWGSRRCR